MKECKNGKKRRGRHYDTKPPVPPPAAEAQNHHTTHHSFRIRPEDNHGGEPMPHFIERRRSRRIPVSYPIKYRIAGENEERAGVCVNISGSGILFRTDEIIEPGRALEIRIEPDNRLTPP